MPAFLKLPPKVLLHVAGYLTKQSDCLALALTCRELQIVGEQELYSNVMLRLKHDVAADNRMEMLYRCLTSFEPRCEWVRSFSVTLLRPPTSKELEGLAAIMRMLPCLDSFKFEFPSTDSSNAKQIDLRCRLIDSMSPKSSLRRFIWLNADTLDGQSLLSFLRFHRGLHHLEFNDYFEVPKIGIDILPNIEVLRAPIATVLRLLPGRQIRRVKTMINDKTSPKWMGMSCLDMEKITTFSSTVSGGAGGVEMHESLIQQLGCLEFLEIQAGHTTLDI
ncbi:hypothetical protein EYR40_007501 [Pleurotus pulmonarius]|nr:hypothetical protein EYR38_008196 [Pleurotus pulmonarius]KAF4597051.1 hypothetical protein EYR40_007501 [Pleurotus pulmonarius]